MCTPREREISSCHQNLFDVVLFFGSACDTAVGPIGRWGLCVGGGKACFASRKRRRTEKKNKTRWISRLYCRAAGGQKTFPIVGNRQPRDNATETQTQHNTTHVLSSAANVHYCSVKNSPAFSSVFWCIPPTKWRLIGGRLAGGRRWAARALSLLFVVFVVFVNQIDTKPLLLPLLVLVLVCCDSCFFVLFASHLEESPRLVLP